MISRLFLHSILLFSSLAIAHPNSPFPKDGSDIQNRPNHQFFSKNLNADIMTYDDFYRSLKQTSDKWKDEYIKQRSEEHLEYNMGSLRLDYLQQIPTETEYESMNDSDLELLASLAYQSANIPCLEYILRKRLALVPFTQDSRLAEEINTHNRPEAIALFLLYEPISDMERMKCIMKIIEKGGKEHFSCIMDYYVHFHELHEAEGTSESKKRQSENHDYFGPALDIHFF